MAKNHIQVNIDANICKELSVYSKFDSK